MSLKTAQFLASEVILSSSSSHKMLADLRLPVTGLFLPKKTQSTLTYDLAWSWPAPGNSRWGCQL